jgi:hypothetical protein
MGRTHPHWRAIRWRKRASKPRAGTQASGAERLVQGEIMATYAIVSRLSPQAISDPKDLKKLAETVSSEIKRQCPQVTWRQSFATLCTPWDEFVAAL